MRVRMRRTVLLTLGLLASTLVGCVSLLDGKNDTLAGYRQELAELVETGVLTNDDAKKFYGIASLEMERRAAQRHQPSDPIITETEQRRSFHAADTWIRN